ncbi:MAG: hypothetical protein OMM_06142 [Candidatus Magnetoglobus multicellularis str. Araruama]|uniref:Fibronectin type-III domain-containing protein n=1 Tax=Candidatus Magnetoglobus multicellularis str. Araruama TaxID=890399 RepID=A0A1V1NR71_9BACT|nr:MAG: hypothetical protein OMM_06142 [Candidatus Magnetoglobus multicellularis str. Araruama]
MATDDISLTNTLAYRVYSSRDSYGNHVGAWETCATALSDWMINTNTYEINNLYEFTEFYFTVLVRDENGNKAIYAPLFIPQYQEMVDINLPGVQYGSGSFVDFDNDGDLDIFISGDSDNGSIAKIYKNSSASFSEDIAVEITGVSHSSVEFGDYDNDGDIDIIIPYSDYGTKIYRNTGSRFIEVTDIILPKQF